MADAGVAALVNDLAEFLEGGCAILVGTSDAASAPHAARAWGTSVIRGRRWVRILLPTDETTVWANLRSTGRIAICYTDVATYRSVQVKGKVVEIPDGATSEDLALWDSYQDRFFLAVEDGSMTPRALVSRLLPSAVRPAVVEVVELFDQTPGPVAGEALRSGSR